MNEPRGAPAWRSRRSPSPSTSATKNQDVLLFVDNIFRFTQAGSEVSALLGRIPSAVGFQPTLADRRWARSRSASPRRTTARHLGAGRFTSRRRPHRPGARHHLRPPRRDDGSLARHRRGHLPRGGPARLHVAHAPARGRRRASLPRRPRRPGTLRSTRTLQDIIAILGMDELSGTTKRTVARAPHRALLSQPFFVASQFTGLEGRFIEAVGPRSRRSRRSSRASTTTSRGGILPPGRHRT